MDEKEEFNPNQKCIPKARNSRSRTNTNNNQNHQELLQNSNRIGFCNQTYPALLPLPPLIPLPLSFAPSFHQNQSFRTKPHFPKPLPILNKPPISTSSVTNLPDLSAVSIEVKSQIRAKNPNPQLIKVARRPDSGGVEGSKIALLANHFLVHFDPTQRIFHYDVEISPSPSKEIARMIKKKLVIDNASVLSNALPAYDGRRNLYSPLEFRKNRFEIYISLPILSQKSKIHTREKLFKVNIRLVSKLDGKELSNYLNKDGEDGIPLPQDYLHALDVVLRENPIENCIAVGRSLYAKSMGGGKDIGGGAIGLRGFFQSLRPTQQGLAMNVDFSVTAFHESIGVIEFLQKRLEFLNDLEQGKNRVLSVEEKNEVEKVLKNVRVFVCHRETVQRYQVYGLTEDETENLWFKERDGTNLKLLDYFKNQYDYDIQYRNFPCLQISRRRPCYLPMELCVVCEGQKFLGKLSDDQTARILKIGCQKPRERKAIIDGVMAGAVGPISGIQGSEFKLNVSREMTHVNGRILQPPKLKLGDGGSVTDLIPTRRDRHWNLLESHVLEGTKIDRWALVSFGGTVEQKSIIPKFINQLTQRCEQLGIMLNKNTIISPQYEPMQSLNCVSVLESKLKKIYRAASDNLQLLICVMEKRHKGYGDLKRISETSIGVVSQCCLYSNINKPSSQFLANLALKINAKIGGSTVELYNSLPTQIPRIFKLEEPVIFMGADVTHPHPLDDSSPSVAAVVGSVNWPAANRYVSRMRSQTHRQEIIEELSTMVGEILEDFNREQSKLPTRIIFFRDGVSETQFYKVLEVELQAIRTACSKLKNYKPFITFAVVQKRHHTRLFPNESVHQNPGRPQFVDENVPPGTVVDSVITHPKEFDFYLCSHWGVKGTSRPTHYHVLWDESEFTSDELQKLVYNLCYTFVRCTKPVSLVPPAYYAHLAAYRGRLYLDRSDYSSAAGFVRSGSTTFTRASAPKTVPLPKVSENVKNRMFYC